MDSRQATNLSGGVLEKEEDRMSQNTGMRQELGLDLERYDKLLVLLGKSHSEVYCKQVNRPEGMEYFDHMLCDLHGSRIRELMEHKKRGGKVVGTFCLFTPEEIIAAAGGISVRLDSGTQLSISDAEAILPRDLCPMIKSFVGLKLSKNCPYFELVDFLVGETTCDGKKKVWEILNEHIPTYVIELPQKKNQMDRELWLRELVSLKEKMEVESGVRITAESLAQSIRKINAKRKALERLYRLRRKNPPPISGKDASLISQIAFYDDPERFTLKVNQLCDELEERVKKGEGVVEPDTPRIMITGCPMVMPDWKLHHIIETSGAVVVCEDTCSGARYFMDPVVDESSTSVVRHLKAIADRYLNIACPCFTPGYCSVLQVTQLAKEFNVSGVIYYVLQFCHGFNVEYHKIEKFLNEAGIPVLRVQTDYGEEDTGQLKTRVEAFLERISTSMSPESV
jgi:benzoyl-CoA reductase/2-hydroxyglutaryl-CoA dehydratase subunit BcrC/BadD/HgdB